MKKFLTAICAAVLSGKWEVVSGKWLVVSGKWKIFLLSLITLHLSLTISGCGNEPPAKVTAEKVLSANDTPVLIHEGKITASKEIKVFSPVSGNVMEKYFEDGSDVEERQLLFQIDTPENNAELSQGKVALAESMTALAKALVENDPKAPELQAEVEQNKLRVQELEEAVLRGMIYAPKAGRLGAVDAPQGMPVIANETLLATIGDINPVVVSFEISETESKLLTTADNLKITLRFSDGMTYPVAGAIKILSDNKTAEVYFENPDEILLLGTTAQIEIGGVKISNELLAPETSIRNNGAEDFVFVAEDKKAAVKKILLGDKVGTYFIVKDGLKANDQIITNGFENLREGTPLEVTEDK